MTDLINSDGSRNWEANILLDNIKRLEQENIILKEKLQIATNSDKETFKILQENKVLQAYKDINEDFKKAWDELNEKHKRYRSAFEEIRDYLNTLSSIDSDFPNTETYLRIQNKINECLGE